MMRFGRRGISLIAVVGATMVAACAERRDPAPVVYRGTQPGVPAPASAPAPATPMPAPEPPPMATADASGIVDYGGYRAVIARQGDTVASMAARAGLPATQLAAYNGLPTGHAPRAGDELILPPDTPTRVASAAPAVEAAPLDPMGQPGSPAASPGQPAPESFDLDRIGATLEEPAVAPDPTSGSASPVPDPVAAPEPAGGSNPVAAPTPAAVAAPPRPAARQTEATPAGSAPREVAAAPPAPQPAPGARFVRPVSGTMSQPFNRAPGPDRSDGVSYAAAAGSTVVAVADGQVALVSEALGGDLGTVILIRHQGQVLTVYGRVDAQVAQGERVSQGQVIGTVASAPDAGEPSLHFEVRRGTEPVDPEPFFSS